MVENKKVSRRDTIIMGIMILLAVGLLIEGAYIYQLHATLKKGSNTVSQIAAVQRKQPLFNTAVDQWDPFDEMERMQQNINRMFRNSLWRGGIDFGFDNFSSRNSFFEPDSDIEDKKDKYIVRLDVPGMEKEKIEVSVRDGYLTISGERKHEEQEKSKKGNFFRMERSFGRFQRTIPIPSDIKEDEVSAEYKRGVLTVTLPKVKPETGEKKPEVKKIAVS